MTNNLDNIVVCITNILGTVYVSFPFLYLHKLPSYCIILLSVCVYMKFYIITILQLFYMGILLGWSPCTVLYQSTHFKNNY